MSTTIRRSASRGPRAYKTARLVAMLLNPHLEISAPDSDVLSEPHRGQVTPRELVCMSDGDMKGLRDFRHRE